MRGGEVGEAEDVLGSWHSTLNLGSSPVYGRCPEVVFMNSLDLGRSFGLDLIAGVDFRHRQCFGLDLVRAPTSVADSVATSRWVHA